MEKAIEKKSFLPDVFSIIGNLFTAVIIFIGLIYTTNGNLWLSGFICLVVMILNYILPDRLAYFKSKKNKKPQIWQEVVLGIFYFLLAIAIFVIGNHCVNIDLFNKDTIKKSAQDKMLLIDQLKNDYSAEIEHKKITLETKATTFYTDYTNNQAIADSQKMSVNIDSLNVILSTPGKLTYNNIDLNNAIASKKSTIEASLNLDQFLSDKNFNNRIQAAKEIIENWKFLKLNYHYKDLDSLYTILLNESKSRIPEFQPALGDNKSINLAAPLESLTEGKSSVVLLSILIFIVLNLCILAPYINTKRYRSGLGSISTKKYQGPKGIDIN